jgi:hypothetical protein
LIDQIQWAADFICSLLVLFHSIIIMVVLEGLEKGLESLSVNVLNRLSPNSLHPSLNTDVSRGATIASINVINSERGVVWGRMDTGMLRRRD